MALEHLEKHKCFSTLSLCKTFYVTRFVLTVLETRDFYVCLYWTNFNLLVFNLFLLFAGEAGEAHVGQLGQRIGCMVRIEYGMGVPVSG